jgi:hypothetical protein
VESLALAYEPKNMIDLNWKIMLLSDHRPREVQAQIEQLIDKLYEYETPKADGRIHSTRRPSRRTLSPTTRCWRWQRRPPP